MLLCVATIVNPLTPTVAIRVLL